MKVLQLMAFGNANILSFHSGYYMALENDNGACPLSNKETT